MTHEMPHTDQQALRTKIRTAIEYVGGTFDGTGVWVMSILATLALPCLPVAVEYIKSAKITDETFTVTSAVMSSAFIFTAESKWTQAVYASIFITSLLLNLGIGPHSPTNLSGWGGYLLISLLILHGTERFWWHVFLDRPFPDWIENSNGA